MHMCQMSPKVFQSPFGSEVKLSVNSNHETSDCASTSSEVYDTNPWRTQVYLGQVYATKVFSKLMFCLEIKDIP